MLAVVIANIAVHTVEVTIVKGVQCYEFFGGIALKIHTFSFFSNSGTNIAAILLYVVVIDVAIVW